MPQPQTTDERYWSRYLARRDVTCPACGYSLRGGRSPVCAECGHVASLRELRLRQDPTGESWYLSGGWALAAACVMGCVPGLTFIVIGSLAALGIDGGARVQASLGASAARGSWAQVGTGLTAVGVGALVVGLPLVMTWVWPRAAVRLQGWHETLRWFLVTVFVGAAAFNALLTLAVLAGLGLRAFD